MSLPLSVVSGTNVASVQGPFFCHLDAMWMLAARELTVGSASSLTVRARWSCRALTVTWACTAPSAGTHISTQSHQYTHKQAHILICMQAHTWRFLADNSGCDSQVIYSPPPLSNSFPFSHFLTPPLIISLCLSLMARVNWLLSNCCSLAWVTKHVRRSKQNPCSLTRLCSPSFFIFVFLFLQFPFWRFFKRRSAHYLPLLIHSPWTRKHLSRHRWVS